MWAYSMVGCERIFSALVFQGIATSASADAYPADGWVENVKYVSAPKSQLSSVGKCAVGSYVGAGVAGVDSPNVLQFPFVPKTVEILAYFSSSAVIPTLADKNGRVALMICDRLGEEYSDGTGLFNGSPSDANMMRGKRSADGKTVYWYTNDAGTQFNQSGYTYYYRALG